MYSCSLRSSRFRFLQTKRGKRARALGKKEQKSRSGWGEGGGGERGGEGKETPVAEPRHFTERPQMVSLPWGLHTLSRQMLHENQSFLTSGKSQRKQNRGGQLVYFKLQYFNQPRIKVHVNLGLA